MELMLGYYYSIPNGPPCPSPALALFGSAWHGPTLSGPTIVLRLQPKHGPMDFFLCQSGTTARLAHRARPARLAHREAAAARVAASAPAETVAWREIRRSQRSRSLRRSWWSGSLDREGRSEITVGSRRSSSSCSRAATHLVEVL
jgi:hypothetical protein